MPKVLKLDKLLYWVQYITATPRYRCRIIGKWLDASTLYGVFTVSRRNQDPEFKSETMFVRSMNRLSIKHPTLLLSKQDKSRLGRQFSYYVKNSTDPLLNADGNLVLDNLRQLRLPRVETRHRFPSSIQATPSKANKAPAQANNKRINTPSPTSPPLIKRTKISFQEELPIQHATNDGESTSLLRVNCEAPQKQTTNKNQEETELSIQYSTDADATASVDTISKTQHTLVSTMNSADVHMVSSGLSMLYNVAII